MAEQKSLKQRWAELPPGADVPELFAAMTPEERENAKRDANQ